MICSSCEQKKPGRISHCIRCGGPTCKNCINYSSVCPQCADREAEEHDRLVDQRELEEEDE